MYSSCIFCTRPLGSNQVLETFPVGRRLAFDPWRGRLWAVCPRCARWNLSPIEERWEAVETAEKLFRSARLRVHSENIGLARLPDGTDLIRVGAALPGELAAWRYGERLLRRHRTHLLMAGALGAGGLGLAGLWAAGAVGFFGIWIASDFAGDLLRRRAERRTIHVLQAEDSPTGEALLVQEAHLLGTRLELDAHDTLLMHFPGARVRRGSVFIPRLRALPEMSLHGDPARRLLCRAMVHVNGGGGSRAVVSEAVNRLAAADAPETLVHDAVRAGFDLGDALARTPILELPGVFQLKRKRRRRGRPRGPGPTRSLRAPDLLALEMALNEESERRAMAGELAGLAAAWREAEEIAAIADALPDDRIVLPAWLTAGR
jgi:hypothetical protein